MRHRKAGRQFSRNTSHRRAMLRALTANLVAHERIETTDAKAKELRRVAERMITRAIRLGKVAYTPHEKLSIADRARRLAAQRQMSRFLRRFAVVTRDEGPSKIDLVEKVFVDLAKRFKDRPGGYTRVIKVGRRQGDNAPMSIVELVDRPGAIEDGPKASTKKAEKAPVETKADTKAGSTKKQPSAAKAKAESAAAEPAKDESPEVEAAETAEKPVKAAAKRPKKAAAKGPDEE